jgi:hypothetical protein
MNLFTSLILTWLIIPALWTYKRNKWLTRWYPTWIWHAS